MNLVQKIYDVGRDLCIFKGKCCHVLPFNVGVNPAFYEENCKLADNVWAIIKDDSSILLQSEDLISKNYTTLRFNGNQIEKVSEFFGVVLKIGDVYVTNRKFEDKAKAAEIVLCNKQFEKIETGNLNIKHLKHKDYERFIYLYRDVYGPSGRVRDSRHERVIE